MSSMSELPKGVSPASSVSAETRTSSVQQTTQNSPAAEIGKPATIESFKKGLQNAIDSEKHSTLNKVGRTIAGLAGGALYGAALIGGGAYTVATAPVFLVIGGGAAILGASAGAIKGALRKTRVFDEKGVEVDRAGKAADGAKEGAMRGLYYTGAALSLAPTIVYHTVGQLGASLTAFAITGTSDEKVRNKNIEKANESVLFGSTQARNKTPQERLMDALMIVSLPAAAALRLSENKQSFNPRVRENIN